MTIRSPAKTAGRHAGVLFLVTGLLVLADSRLLASTPIVALDLLGAADLACAAFAWLAPWDRWPPRATLLIVPPALTIIAVANHIGDASPYTYAFFYIALFIWIGVTQPPRTSFLVAPFTAVAYVVPLLGARYPGFAARSATVAIPVCVMVAEVISRTMAMLEAAHRESQHRADLLATVARATHDSLSSLDSDAVVAALVDALLPLGFDAAALNMLDGGDTYSVAHARGFPEGYLNSRYPISIGVTGLVAGLRDTVVMEDYASDSRAVPEVRAAGIRSVVGAPVLVDGKVIAVLVGGSKTRLSPSREDVEAFTTIAHQAGRALENARRYEEEHRTAERHAQESLVDDLTRIGNRRHANHILRTLQPGDALVIMDLDHFKGVNDERGHAYGDQLLAWFADYLRGAVRESDDIARYGGEEFVMIMRGPKRPLQAADRLLEGWRLLEPPVTFSAGISVHQLGRPAPETLAEADAALYQAKSAGRDRVYLFTQVVLPVVRSSVDL